MDQDAFRKTYRDVNERACLFEKSVLTNQCQCSQAERFCIAEREGVHCLSDEAQARCDEALALLREHARFALRASEDKAILPHGKAMRIQVGGLRGIRALLEPDVDDPLAVPDVAGILLQAIERYRELAGIPYSEVMPSIAAYQGKTRARRRKRD
jgi:hypothetical protein